MNWKLRLAEDSDIPRIAELIPISVRTLQAGYYSPAQMEAALGLVFAVDRQLITDGTYFVAEADGRLVGCGGWSRRRSLCGGDHGRTCPDQLIDPATDPARVRAFSVHPDCARQGIGRRILAACETAVREAGFRRVELAATLAGVPLYTACGYVETERFAVELPNAPEQTVVRTSNKL